MTFLLVAALFPASSVLATNLQIPAASTNGHTVSRPEMASATARFAATPAAQAGLQPVAPPDPLGDPSTDAALLDSDGASPFWTVLSPILTALALMATPLLAYFGLREIVVRTMVFFMMRRGSTSGPPEATPAPAAVAPRSPLELLEMSTLNGILLNGRAQDRLDKAEFTAWSKVKTLWWSLLAHALGVAVTASVVAWRLPDVGTTALPALGILFFLDLLAAFYALTTHLQGLRVIEFMAVLVTALSTAAAVVTTISGVPVYLALVPVLAQVTVLTIGWRRIRRDVGSGGNRKIAILRVFGSDRNAAFTFGRLMSQWRFVGSYLTVADPAYLRHHFSIFSRGNASRSLGTSLTLGAAVLVINGASTLLPNVAPGIIPESWAALDYDDQRLRIRAVAIVAVAVLAVVPSMLYVSRRFLRESGQAVARVERIERARLSVESDYPGAALFCFDDVWKPAVHRMLEIADVVLMDLRGFSAERQGCAYEIRALIDWYSVDRVLFLVDEKTPREPLRRLVLEAWAAMRPESPNHDLRSPVLKIYATGDRERRDIPRIAALLSASLEGRLQVSAQGLALWA